MGFSRRPDTRRQLDGIVWHTMPIDVTRQDAARKAHLPRDRPKRRRTERHLARRKLAQVQMVRTLLEIKNPVGRNAIASLACAEKDKGILPGTPGHLVVPKTTQQTVIARIAKQRVIQQTPLQKIIAPPPQKIPAIAGIVAQPCRPPEEVAHRAQTEITQRLRTVQSGLNARKTGQCRGKDHDDPA